VINVEQINKYILIFCLLFAISCCEAQEPALAVVGLKLSEVFRDPVVRKLANAAANGDTNQINQLIAQGSNVNAQGKYGITPLWWALMTTNYGGFVYLLEKGASPNTQVKGGYENVMFASAMENDSRFLKAAIKAGGNVNLVSERDNTLPHNTITTGQTPLFGAMYATRMNNMSNVDLLLASGANINFQDLDGNTILNHARNYTISYYLLTKGADPTLTNRAGNTFIWVVKHKRIAPQYYPERQKVIDLLRKKGIIVEIANQ